MPLARVAVASIAPVAIVQLGCMPGSVDDRLLGMAIPAEPPTKLLALLEEPDVVTGVLHDRRHDVVDIVRCGRCENVAFYEEQYKYRTQSTAARMPLQWINWTVSKTGALRTPPAPQGGAP